MAKISAMCLSLVLLPILGCKREPDLPVQVGIKRSQFLLVTHQKITDSAVAVSNCEKLCKAESGYWNGYYSTTNPFGEGGGGICECIKARDPYPGKMPLTFGLTTSDLEGTYGRISVISEQVRSYGFHLEASASAGEGGAGGSATSSAGGGKASASASTGSASASANGASSKAGAAADGGASSQAGRNSAKSDGTTSQDKTGNDHGSIISKSSSDGIDGASFTISPSSDTVAAARTVGASVEAQEAASFQGDTFEARTKVVAGQAASATE